MQTSFFSLAALLAAQSTALAWGADGHRVTGMLAEARLTPEALAEVRELLGKESLADASTWADEVRRRDEFRWSAPLHYVNGPRDAEDLDVDRDCPDARCVVGAVNTYTQVLLNTEAPRAERAEALKWVVHFIGDMHQPLHAGFADDRGGNSISITFMRERSNLHRLWDSGLFRAAGAENDEQLAELIEPLITDESAAQWQAETEPLRWADESFDYARLHLYPDPADADRLGQAYLDEHLDTATRQLAAASVRLAAHLNAVLGRPEDQE